MKRKAKITGPVLPVAANAEAFIRNTSPPAPESEERKLVMIKLSAASHRQLKIKAASEGSTIQAVGERLLLDYLGKDS